MEVLGILVAAAILAAGGLLVVMGVQSRLAPAVDPTDWLRGLDEREDGPVDEYEHLLSQPFVGRIVRPLGTRSLRAVAGLTPSNHLERVQHQLLLAGLSPSVRAEELVTLQALGGGAGLLLGLLFAIGSDPSPRIGALALVLLPVVGLLAPQSWLTRKVAARSDAIRRDMPDTIDLLAISVEAGLGLEGAMEIVCRHSDSPLGNEFSRSLKEMELGLPRREALHNLKRRTEVPELSNFVLILTQADALGMPIGRVLKAQAAELRSKRRQWAREKAGKLPVKILFPLVLFIFPAVMVVVLGPAAADLARAF